MNRNCCALVIGAVFVVPRPSAADTQINFFGDINYSVEKHEETSNSFRAATLDIFAMQREGKFGFMGEIVGRAFGSNEFTVDIDRLEASYEPRPWLRLRAGRLRTAWGYYGDAYQNGKFFMLPVVWPDVYETFSHEGILPTRSVGLHADATKSFGEDRGGLRVDLEVLNGRGGTHDEVAAFADANNHKAINARVRYVGGGALEGLIVGANLYWDQIPRYAPEAGEVSEEHEDHGATPAQHELIVGAHAAYMARDVHAIAEFAWFRHRENGTPMIHNTYAGFVEVGYTIKDWTPYARYEHMEFVTMDDPYFHELTEDSTLYNRFSAGVKYAASASVAVKLQGALQKDDDDIDKIAIIQAAFAF